MAERKPFAGGVALVAGGAGGLGRAIAARLIQRGMRCLLVDIDPQALDRAVQALGPMAMAHVADLTDPTAWQLLVQQVQARWGRLDLLVNNAGMVGTTPFEQRGQDSIRNELELNLMAPLLLTHSLLPLLQCTGDGRVVSIVSLGGMFPLPESTVYSASKFGLRCAMLCLGLDGARLGVRFSIVNPSATETPMLMREAIHGGNKLQFMDPPQMPDEVALQVMRCLDQPCLERFVRPAESWTVRLAMLLPNCLVRALPLFQRRAEQGHQRYLDSLVARGLVRQEEGVWVCVADARR
ncbi:SDR family NAD(P)-dependent oxidoreductase [Acidovorax sp. SUPP1855]|uniref:SDR family NAD(P)-dependent oxidoreductase n=1 Tax=Acidovorax sp. SUPP1855 TaxID=431774 RepID=UPI0023DE3F72|nr:SDR family NAD(P)-dependent oxidoreductase [Acidovorax sp. SUPP1855]GKS83376.1 SDR family NAD(P)-dependent oxidoreductase [Acidovorax sp. SUPP1855]